ncbi:MAG TPA: helix-turn-helix domain-containing protein [Hyphomicrobium sp.]|jgi:thiamine transporter ThiT
MLRQKRQFEIALLVALCLVLPIVSIPLAAKGPGVSLQAATMMINELRSNLLELTGRGSSRAWAVI